MCDNDSIGDMNETARLNGELSRRKFGALTVGSGLAFVLPRLADAADTKESEVEIKTADGTCDAYFVAPSSGKHPAVLVWPDIFGLRPAFRQMGKRLAESGYAVLVVNPFYRVKHAPTIPDPNHPGFTPETQQAMIGMMNALTPQTVETDAKAFVAWLDKQSSVDPKKKFGTTGYCMGGPFTFRTAALLPDRIGAIGSFHGAALVTDKPDSPHLLVPKMKVQALVAIAANDDQKQPEQKTALKEAFDKAHLKAEVEVYAGAQHGWCPPDTQVYNHDQAEKAWSRMLATFKTSLV